MRVSISSALVLTSLLVVAPAVAQSKLAISPRILFAKSLYFDNQTSSDVVGKNALAQLKRWGRFQIVADPKQADLIFLLSADPYNGGKIIFASGQTGMVYDGQINKDPVPVYSNLSPARYAYLTVIDTKTGDELWSGYHPWGGLLTGFNSVGERLVREAEKQTTKLESLLKGGRTHSPGQVPSP